MGIQEIDLRRLDFEAMHPVARLFNFDHEKLTYFGDAYDDAKRLNDLWSTWCACVGLLYLKTNTAKAQAVPEGFVLVEKAKLMQIVGSAAIIEPITRGNPLMSKYKTELDFILSTVRAMIEAQEQKG